jgi:type IV fimbrial biogenesis protein FimT
MKNQTGFTLIELIIAVTILGIMVSLAVPNYSSFIRSNRQSAAYNTLVGTISLARMEAVKSSRVVSMCISSDQSKCDDTTAKEWNDGWIVFSDFDGDGVVDTADGDTILRREAAGPEGIEIQSTDFGSLISMAPRGRLRTQGTFVVCDGTGDASKAMALNLWVTGLGRMAVDTDDDDDDIVETLSDTNVTCPSATTSSD